MLSSKSGVLALSYLFSVRAGDVCYLKDKSSGRGQHAIRLLSKLDEKLRINYRGTNYRRRLLDTH